MPSFEQRANIKFSVKLIRFFTEILALMNEAYGDEKLSQTQVYFWYKGFKDGRKSNAEYSRSGQPLTSTTNRNIGQKKKVRPDNSKGKVILVVFFDYQGLVYHEFIKDRFLLINRHTNKYLCTFVMRYRTKRNQLVKSKYWKLLHIEGMENNRRKLWLKIIRLSPSPQAASIEETKPFPVRNLFVPFLLDVQTLLSGISVCLFHLCPSCVAFHHDCTVELTSRFV
ncbi:hypothetical protein LAZ67_23001635 [Cordylochernes scorpioides]|uniref:Mos1 transposase HTH domain-containing protein n=1 Tax=Cordylochernes scorpioides TaxID=51811 RepID=A0ABY6LSV4_9ARAC|nr:hypothetical protein LAZ67_23001635 [Cordylochernes scorpioides]